MARDVQIVPDKEAAWSRSALDAYGHDHIIISRKHIQALLEGKVLYWADDEYSTSIELDDLDDGS
jgi:hypothetical protein